MSASQLLAALLVGILTTSDAFAQQSEPKPAADSVIAGRVSIDGRLDSSSDRSRTRTRQALDKKFWAVTAALGTTMVLDTRSTFYIVDRCVDCREANPFVAPFVRLGPTPTYTAGILFDAGVMAIAAKMKGSEHRWLRRTWWVAPAALVIGHSVATRHNYYLLR